VEKKKFYLNFFKKKHNLLHNKKMVKIVLIGGGRFNGKDTGANHLVQHYGAKRFAFADALKDEVSSCMSISRELFEAPYKDQPLLSHAFVVKDRWCWHMVEKLVSELTDHRGLKPHEDEKWTIREDDCVLVNQQGLELYWTPRALCIFHGAMMRIMKPDYWCEQVIKHIRQEENKFIVMSDFRYQSEYHCIVKTFGQENVTTLKMYRFPPSSNDPSERDLDEFPFDHTIDNTDSTPDRALKQIDELMITKT
jgi:hypothetical protein